MVLCVMLLGVGIVSADRDNSDCWFDYANFSPNSGGVLPGNSVAMEASGNCHGGLRAIRVTVDGSPRAETAATSQRETLKINEFSIGGHTVCWELAGGGNTSWENAEQVCRSFTFGAVIEGELPSNSGNSGSSGNAGSSSGGTRDMDVYGACVAAGYTGVDYNISDAYSWVCTKEGSQDAPINVDGVCNYSTGGTHPYAGLRNASDAFSWYCATTPQGRPDSSVPVEQPSNTGSTDSSGSSGNEGSQGNSGGANTSGNSGSSGTSTCNVWSPVYPGDRGAITPGPSNNYRSGPGTGYTDLGELDGGTQFDVVSGPFCADGYTWIGLDWYGQTVYTAVGTSGSPWVEKVGSRGDNSSSGGISLSIHFSRWNHDYLYILNTGNCVVENGDEVVANELSRFGYWMSSASTIDVAIYLAEVVGGIESFRRHVLKVVQDNSGCETFKYKVGDKYMDPSGLGNISFGYYEWLFPLDWGEVIANITQAGNPGSIFQFDDNPDDRTQRCVGQYISAKIGYQASISPDVVREAASSCSLE